MDIHPSAPYISNPNVLIGENMNTKWTPAENKLFEKALAVYDKDTSDRWVKVAAIIPGKTVGDVMKQYKELEEDINNIEAGLIPIPGYYSPTTSQFTLDWVNTPGYDGFKPHGGKRSSSGKPYEQERKKGVPWTEEEHKRFLLGLNKYGKGDWRNISRNFVVTRTPTQVASHAQKFFIRQLSGGKDKRRASIHDITTVNLPKTTRTPSPLEDISGCNSKQEPNSTPTAAQAHFQWNQPNAGGVAMGFNPYGIDPYGLKVQSQNLMHRSALHESSYLGPQTQNLVFQMPSTQHFSHA